MKTEVNGELVESFTPERRARYDEFLAAQWEALPNGQRRRRRFVRDPITALEAVRDDPTETWAARVLAWAKIEAWGNYSLYCIDKDGKAKTQADAARQLGTTPQIVSNAIAYHQERGRIEPDTGKLIYPVLSPSKTAYKNVTGASDKSSPWQTFLELEKVTRSHDILALEVARSEVERLRKVILSRFKCWLALGQPSLLTEITTDPKPEGSAPEGLVVYSTGSSSSSFSETRTTTTTTIPEPTKPHPRTSDPDHPNPPDPNRPDKCEPRPAEEHPAPPEREEPLPEEVWAFAASHTEQVKPSRREVRAYVDACRVLARKRGQTLSSGDLVAIMQMTVNAAAEAIRKFGYFVSAAPKMVEAYLDHDKEPFARSAAEGDAALNEYPPETRRLLLQLGWDTGGGS